MTIAIKTRSESFQYARTAPAEFTAADLNSTDFVPILTLPAGAIPLRGFMAIDTVDGAATTIAVGTATTPNLYLVATSANALAKTALDADLENAGAPLAAPVVVGLTASAAMTAVTGRVVIEYIRKGVGDGTQD